MRSSYPFLCAAIFVLQGHVALGREQAPGMLDPSPIAWGMRSAANAPSLRLAQAPAASQQPTTLPAQRTETINYDNWILTCRELLEGAKKRTCAATVAVQRTENGQTVFALTVQLSDQAKLTASIQTPTGVAIAPGVEVKFEKTGARKAAFEICEPTRCVANLVADTTFIRDAAAATSLTLSMQSSDGKPVNFEFPIKGFDKAYAKMTKG